MLGPDLTTTRAADHRRALRRAAEARRARRERKAPADLRRARP